jgi:hypothetical protein
MELGVGNLAGGPGGPLDRLGGRFGTPAFDVVLVGPEGGRRPGEQPFELRPGQVVAVPAHLFGSVRAGRGTGWLRPGRPLCCCHGKESIEHMFDTVKGDMGSIT